MVVKLIKYFSFILITCFLFFSCASNKLAREKAVLNYKAQKYKALESYFLEENKNGDKINIILDEAMVKTVEGDYKKSVQLFNNAYLQMQMLTGEMSAGDNIVAGLISENSIKYSGPAYEYSLLDSMSAYNFIKLEDLDSARAMMRRSLNNNKKLFNELKARQKEFEAKSISAVNSANTMSAIESFASAGVDVPINKLKVFTNTDKTDYQLSPFIFYLGSVLFANDNNMAMANDWIVNIADSLNVDIINSIVNIPKNKGSINVISLADNILSRKEAVKYFTVFRDLFNINVNFKLTYPEVPSSKNLVKDVYVTVIQPDSKKIVADKRKAVIVEDFDNAVRLDVNSKASGAYSRSLIRNITRKSAAYIAGITAINASIKELEKQDVPLDFFIVQSAIIALQAGLDSIDMGENADIRQGIFFPSKARAAGIVLSPGVYDVIVDYVNKKGKVVKRDIIKSVEVKPGVPSVAASDFINTGNIEMYNDYQY